MISLESKVYALPTQAGLPPGETTTVYAAIGKRLFDITVTALLTMLVFIWLVPIIALAIVISSPGPLVFAQLRTGRNGRPFRCLKFRTTVYQFQPGFRQEPQLSPVGRILRATRLDDLPNFANVLMGDMSIVGPRPHTLQQDAQCWTQPGYRDRHRVRPGVTGLVQTRTCLTELPGLIQLQNSIRYDRWYVSRSSFLLDFKICWWTITGAQRAPN